MENDKIDKILKVIRKSLWVILQILLLLTLVIFVGINLIELMNKNPYRRDMVQKPVIYMYSDNEKDVDISLDLNGKLTTSYPEYINDWKVKIINNNILLDESTNKKYDYLFYEAEGEVNYDKDSGFIVSKDNIDTFLEEKLSYMGLNDREMNDFITYWTPKLKESPYVYINFANKEYEQFCKLNIYPKPDSILRIFMVYKSLDAPVSVKPQNLNTFDRNGFSVIEWGGKQIG